MGVEQDRQKNVNMASHGGRYLNEKNENVNISDLLEFMSGYAITKGSDGKGNIDKFGVNRQIDSGSTPEDVWENGGVYNFSPVTTLTKDAEDNITNFVGNANITQIASSSILDTQEIIVIGLGADGYEVIQTVTLLGQTPVTLSTPLWRVYRALNNSNGNTITGNPDTNIQGTVYIATSDAIYSGGVPTVNEEVRAIIGSSNQTLMAIYTVPRGKTGYLVKGIVGTSRAQSTGALTFQYLSRRVGKNLAVSFEGTVSAGGSSFFKDERSFPDKIPELTDILIRINDSSANNMGAFAAFDIYLEDNE